jgi:hypothetical protein
VVFSRSMFQHVVFHVLVIDYEFKLEKVKAKAIPIRTCHV